MTVFAFLAALLGLTLATALWVLVPLLRPGPGAEDRGE